MTSQRTDAGRVADAIIILADALNDHTVDIANVMKDLGTGNAATPMGAIELLSKEVKEGSERIASALQEIAYQGKER